jgi:hypothetical protein
VTPTTGRHRHTPDLLHSIPERVNRARVLPALSVRQAEALRAWTLTGAARGRPHAVVVVMSAVSNQLV